MKSNVAATENSRIRSCAFPRARAHGACMDLARVGSRAETVQRRQGSLHRWTASGNRRRRGGGRAGARSTGRHDRVRWLDADERSHGHDPHRRRILDHPRPSRLARGEEELRRARGRPRRQGRGIRPGGVGRALRPPRCPYDERPERVRRPPAVPAGESGTDGGSCARSRPRRRRPRAGGRFPGADAREARADVAWVGRAARSARAGRVRAGRVRNRAGNARDGSASPSRSSDHAGDAHGRGERVEGS